MTIRPEVISVLNGSINDLATVDAWDLVRTATLEEKAAAAAARLVARTQAVGVIKAKLTDILTGSGLTGDEATSITDRVAVNPAAMPHSLAVKIADGAPGIAGLEEIRASYGNGWAEAVAGEARLPVHEVRAIYGEVAPS
jgi:hypothetical protein